MCELGPGARASAGRHGTTRPSSRSSAAQVPKPSAATTRVRAEPSRDDGRPRHEGRRYPEFAFDGFRMMPLGPVPPIDVMAIRPKMLQAAAQRRRRSLAERRGIARSTCATPCRTIERELAAGGPRPQRVPHHRDRHHGDRRRPRRRRAPLAPMLSTFPARHSRLSRTRRRRRRRAGRVGARKADRSRVMKIGRPT